jgi:hypothetical protein
MAKPARQAPGPSHLERVVAALAAVVCLVLTIRIWLVVGQDQPMWPLPAAYLLEVLALAAAAALISIMGRSIGGLIIWIATGAISAFAVLASFSVGLFYSPVVLLLLVSGLLAAWRQRRRIPIYLACAVGAGLLQAGLILGIARLL